MCARKSKYRSLSIFREKWGCLREKCLGENVWEKMSLEVVGVGWGRKECRDPENQLSFI